MFNTQKCTVSKDTQRLLNVMMAESKLTNFQRKQLNANIQDGKPLPVTCLPTSSDCKPKSLQKSHQNPKVMNGRHLIHSGKRKKDTIQVMTEQNQEVYRPSPGKHISEKDKRALQNKMAYGIEVPDAVKQTKQDKYVTQPETTDEFEEILKEINERRQFLTDMEELGRGKEFRTIIETEISQKIHDLEVIDKKRTTYLEEALKDR